MAASREARFAVEVAAFQTVGNFPSGGFHDSIGHVLVVSSSVSHAVIICPSVHGTIDVYDVQRTQFSILLRQSFESAVLRFSLNCC